MVLIVEFPEFFGIPFTFVIEELEYTFNYSVGQLLYQLTILYKFAANI